MAKLLSYNDIKVTIVRHTKNPGALCKTACDMTMQTAPIVNNEIDIDPKLLKFIVTAEHTSVLEHCSITMFVQGVSRSLLAQLSRHRHASLTSQSQHYQLYSNAPMVVSEGMVGTEESFDEVLDMYNNLIDNNVPREEARQILPNAAAVNLLWTVNARGLISFLRPRLCWRNVEEMVVFATKVRHIALSWWPELFKHIGPPCMLGKCNQGIMAKGCPYLEGGYNGAK